ncbi:ATP-binding protein, partial [Streptomyces ruber]|uniref:ATP-binding protein n=2 Tax=Streptomyces TaxID=1883 RepID=UPI00166FE755
LAEELGIEPGPQLQHLQRAVLSADPALAPPAPTTALSGRLEPSWAPCLLPSDAAGFTGREWELAWLDRLTASDAASTAAVVGLISGTPGVGKTGLALHWAHRAQQNFPDGQLYVNLRGYDPEKPMTAGEALARLLAALGLRGQDVPLDVEERAARYRSELSGRRMLVVLDNANSAGQVRSLLPGTATCATLVTSRDALPGLVALHGAHRLVLDLLPADDARTLLRRLIGPRVDAESQAAATLAELCQRLPLTLRLAAELAAARPHHSLAALATELADQHRRLDLLDADEDIGVGVRAVFSWSYQRLPAPAARAFRLLALHPGTDWDAYATAALTDTGPHPARRLLDRLARAHLIEPTGPDRYTMHDLLRAYAAELAATTDPEPDRQVALTRLFDHYLATAITATAFLGHYSGKWRPRLLRAAPLSRASPVGDSAGARAWLDAERPNLTLVCAHAARHGWHEHAQDLAAILFRYLGTGGHYADALAIHTHAHQAARRQGDRHGAAYALTHLSSMYWRQGHYRQAVDHGRRALESFRRVGDRSGEAHALLNLCLVYWRQGHYRQAVDHGRRALESFRRVGDRSGEGYARLGLGLVHWRQGDYGRAVEQYRRALDLFRRLGDQSGRAYALTCQGLVDWRQGDHGRAVEQHRRALDLFRRLGDRAGQAEALTHLALVDWRQGDHGRAVEQHRRALDLFQRLGDQAGQAYTLTHLALVHCRQGNRPRAMEQHRRALDLARQTGYRAVEAEALNGLGETLQMSGQAVQARTWHADALAMAEAIGDRYEQARAHQGIAATHHTTNDLHLARRHWQDALSLYCDLGVPEADTIRAQLSALTHQNINPPAPP